MCASVCSCEWGVSLSGSSGEEPTTGFHRAHRCLFFGGGGVKNNNQIRGSASRSLRFNCIRVSVPTESLRTEAETRAARGCVMSDEALWASKKATVECV